MIKEKLHTTYEVQQCNIVGYSTVVDGIHPTLDKAKERMDRIKAGEFVRIVEVKRTVIVNRQTSI